MNTNTFKKILLVLIGVIVVGGVAAYVYITQTNKEVEPFISESDKTTIGEVEPSIAEKHPDWKTCKSETYGYEFNYPSNLEVTSSEAIVFPNGWGNKLVSGCEKRVVFFGNPANNTPRLATLSVGPVEMSETYLSESYANGNSIRFVKKLSINNFNTFWFETNCDVVGECAEKYTPFVIFTKNENQFWLQDFSIENQTVIEDIIETFKFTQ